MQGCIALLFSGESFATQGLLISYGGFGVQERLRTIREQMSR